MGMAASQARFLGLTARMNNIEYEGQQINQQRTALANKSASYYTDLLGMSVPTAPSVEEFTQTVYSFNDGALTNQITSLIADPANPGSYKVSYIRSWTDDFAIVSASPSIITKDGGGGYRIGAKTLRTLGSTGGETTVGSSITIDGKTYPVTKNETDGKYYIDKEVTKPCWVECTTAEQAQFEYYKFSADYSSAEQVFKDETSGSFYTLDEDGTTHLTTSYTENDLVICLWDDSGADPEHAVTLVEIQDGKYMKESEEVSTETTALTDAQVRSITSYGGIENDEYLSTLSADQLSNLIDEENAIKEQLNNELNNGDQTGEWFVRYVQNTSTGEYEGVYYKQSDVTGAVYDAKGNSQSFIGAYKLGSAERIEEVKGVEGCALEQDSTGRYINITIDGKEYALSTNTVTDQDAYEDAMNQYEYDKALYDQNIEEINAKIEIIQAEDKNLELRLKQLDTEHNAISNEKDAVSKVIEKAVESGFKTFG